MKKTQNYIKNGYVKLTEATKNLYNKLFGNQNEEKTKLTTSTEEINQTATNKNNKKQNNSQKNRKKRHRKRHHK